jgi:predicted permease
MLIDVKLAFRRLVRTPGFAVTALLTLALCIGANLVIFAVVDSILLRPLPFPEADRLVILFNTYPKAGRDRVGATLNGYYERRGNIPAFVQLASMSYVPSILGESGSTERVNIGRVTPEFFKTLGVEPVMGRSFTDAEMTYQSDHEAILTDEYWRQHFNADPRVLGKAVWTDGLPRTIVGVLPRGFRVLSSDARIFLPLSSEEGERNVGARHHDSDLIQIARLKPGASLSEAQSQVDANNAAHAAEFPFAKEVAAAGFRTIVAPLHADHVASIRPTLLLLQAGALLLLLMGGVNLVNLLLIRAAGRGRELAIRQSIGASRRHVVGQVMVETVLLTLVGGLFGVVAGAWGIRALAAFGTGQLPLGANITFDGRLAIVALAGSILLGIVISLPIALFNLRGHFAAALKSESRSGTASHAMQRTRHGFIIVQIAMAFVLLAGAGLLGLSLKCAMAQPPGFRPDHIITGQFNIPWNGYHDGQACLGYADRLLELANRQPGMSAVGVITDVPLNGTHQTDAITAVGYNPGPAESVILHHEYGVLGDYFAAMGVPLLEGRFLVTADSRSKALACVVDQDFARHYWPKGGAIGQRVFAIPRKEDDSNVFTVVGVVGAVKQGDLTEATSVGAVYLPFIDTFARDYFLVARTSLQPEALAVTLRRIFLETDPEVPVSNIRSMETRIGDSLVARRSPALLTGVFASVAVLLAAIGTYGVLSYGVAQRRREIGVRMALGARPEQIRNQFLCLGLRLLAIGATLGVIGAWLAGRAMQGILFNVPVFHLATVAGTAAVMSVVTLVACLLPSRHAARISPMEALSEE